MVRYSTKKSLFWEISGYWLLRGGIWWLFVVKKTLFTPYDYIILKQNCEVCNACNCIDMTVNYFQLKHQTRKMTSQWPSSQFSDTTWLLNHIIPWPVTSFFLSQWGDSLTGLPCFWPRYDFYVSKPFCSNPSGFKLWTPLVPSISGNNPKPKKSCLIHIWFL